MLMVRSGHRSGSWEVMQMREVSFPVELVRGVPVVAAPEEIDITIAAELQAALLDASGSEAGGHRTFVVDMTRTRFCDSAGIAALVGAHKRAQAEGGRVLLAVSGAAVPRIFELTGIDRIIPSFTSLEEALTETLAGTGPLPWADLAQHAAVDGDQGRLLFVAEALVGADRILGRRGRLRARASFRDPACRVGRDLVDEAGLGHQRFRGNVERV
jgi:anti-sigma B factor antagonist